MTIDNSPKKIIFKQISGTSIVQEICFFDRSNPNNIIQLDITGLNFRVTGSIQNSNDLIVNTVFDANSLDATTGIRNGLFLVQNTTNKLIFLHDFVSDTEFINAAAEGVFTFKIWMTDAYGVDRCIIILEYDAKKANYIDALDTDMVDSVININLSNNSVIINCNVKTLQV